ncbi:DUF488 domain-containing protein [Hymenobacter aerophilus]|uniref:DUF488 domain-containing protein n=1 Tax=Hymenobacter aerophilus TaxID=119644 RepID=UPI0008FBDF06|nr:DUF488 domain-containing protein [Hymenobacter aerophilus]
MKSPSAASIFSCGYQLRTLPSFIEHLHQADVKIVLDVRETPWSYRPGFSAKPLREGLAAEGIGYEHARYAGNPKAIRKQADSHQHCLELYADHLEQYPDIVTQFDQWIQPHLAQHTNVCLLCYERHPADCHRAYLLYRWQNVTGHDVSIIHLDPEGAPRFTNQDLTAVQALVCA